MVHWRKSIKKNYSPVSSERLVNFKAVIWRPPLIDSQRPFRDSHDRPLYGKQFCDMEFICVPGADAGCLAVEIEL
jgi:hypothetical protein